MLKQKILFKDCRIDPDLHTARSGIHIRASWHRAVTMELQEFGGTMIPSHLKLTEE